MTRYSPSRIYWAAGLAALAPGVVSAWFARETLFAAIAAGLFFALATILLFLASRPAIQIDREMLRIGRRGIPWSVIRRVDRTAFFTPLILRITLDGGRRVVLLFPGDLDSAHSLLRHIRKLSTRAMIDGVPHPEFWGEDVVERIMADEAAPPASPLLIPEDEEEVKRLFRRLKTVGHLDSNSSGEEK
jgi:hypothetical protein